MRDAVPGMAPAAPSCPLIPAFEWHSRLWALLLAFILLHGPGGQIIYINPEAIISLRVPRVEGYLSREVQCTVTTNDGKFTTVTETCQSIADLIGKNQ